MATEQPAGEEPADHRGDLLAIYDEALPHVYGYLLRRCGNATLAEDLTSETFMGAVAAARANKVSTVTVAWLVGIARNKLVDHWRRREREERRLIALAGELQDPTDGWDQVVDQQLANHIMQRLAPQHQMALTLRYLDGLPVAQVAAHLDRTLQATETLLTRSKAAFRRAYDYEGSSDD